MPNKEFLNMLQDNFALAGVGGHAALKHKLLKIKVTFCRLFMTGLTAWG